MAGFAGSTARVLRVQPDVLATLGTLLDWLAPLPEDAAVSICFDGLRAETPDPDRRSALSGRD